MAWGKSLTPWNPIYVWAKIPQYTDIAFPLKKQEDRMNLKREENFTSSHNWKLHALIGDTLHPKTMSYSARNQYIFIPNHLQCFRCLPISRQGSHGFNAWSQEGEISIQQMGKLLHGKILSIGTSTSKGKSFISKMCMQFVINRMTERQYIS